MAFDKELHPRPRFLSPSRLNDFRECPRKYEYSAVQKLAQPASYASVKGRYVHAILESLFALAPAERTMERALTFLPEADEKVLTEDVRSDIGYDEALAAKLQRETNEILTTYFSMEDPASVTLVPYKDSDGVEIKMFGEVKGAPLFGILDRLDRDENGDLVIVDYKTGSVPKQDYVSDAFANSALYAALCDSLMGEMPSKIRLLYIAAGATLERSTAEVFPEARAEAAAKAWGKIIDFYEAGDFTPAPSPRSCRWCPSEYKNRCTTDGFKVY